MKTYRDKLKCCTDERLYKLLEDNRKAIVLLERDTATMNSVLRSREGYYTITCTRCKKVTCYTDERPEGTIECMHCNEELEIST